MMTHSNDSGSPGPQLRDEESEPLLQQGREVSNSVQLGEISGASTDLGVERATENEEQGLALTKGQSWNLYLSHFLSTWNARGYEFAAVSILSGAAASSKLTRWYIRKDYLYSISVSRDFNSFFNTVCIQSFCTATPKADFHLRGILTTIATLTLSTSVGRWCDEHPSRLQTLRITIFVQRICVVLACFGWIFIVEEEFLGGGFLAVVRGERSHKKPNGDTVFDRNPWAKAAIMVVVMVLGIGERLSAVGNMMVMERDWVCSPFLLSCYSMIDRRPLPGPNAGNFHIKTITSGTKCSDASY